MWCILVLASGRALAQRPLGTDVSHYQGTINWTSVKNSGVVFAWAKATEGVGYTDVTFAQNEANARTAGVYIGAYHFARPDSNFGTAGADSEAAYFWSVAKNYITGTGAYLMPMLDIEQAPGSSYTQATLSAWVNRWCNDVVSNAAAVGVVVQPVIYTYTSYSASWLNSTVTQWPLWMASYPSNPNTQTGAPASLTPWTTWSLWQYADTNWSGGDSDVFNGSTSAFVSKFVIRSTMSNVTAVVGSNGTFRVATGGTGPFRYQWLFNRTNVIAGATSSNYTVVNAQISNAGPYSVNVSNATTLTVSATGFLSVVSPLTNAPGAAVAPPGMIDWWTADGNAMDIFGADHGTPVGGLSYTPGAAGLAFHFDGTSGYLQLTNPVTPLASPWTVCVWVNRQNSPQAGAALLADATDLLKLEQNGQNRAVGFSRIGTTDWTFSPSYVAPAGVWTHLAFVSSSGSTTLYTNGVQARKLANTIPLGRAFMGGDPSGNMMLGSLDEPMIFNRALSAAQVYSIYSAGSAGLVRAAQYLAPTLYADGSFGLNFQGLTGKNVNLYWTSNFLSWTLLSTVGNSAGAGQFVDTNAAGQRFRFYGIK